MQNFKINSFKINNWLKKTVFMIGCAVIFTIVSFPILSQEDTLINFFYPYDDLGESDVYKAENGNLIDKLKQANNFYNLLDDFEAAGLSETLRNEYFILLAPNDRAFEALSDNEFEIYQKPKNRIEILEYHLLPKQYIPTKDDLRNRNKEKVKIESYGGNEITVYLHNDEYKINNDNMKVFNRIRSNNGVIYEINQVLSPPNIFETTSVKN